MTAFDPRTLGIEKSEFDAAITANPGLVDQFPEAKEYAERLRAATAGAEEVSQLFREEWIEAAKTSTDGVRVGDNVPGVLTGTEEPPFVLEFALSRDGEILSLVSFASVTPEDIPDWAWQAFLEGLVVRARGRAALRVCEEEGRIAGLFADEEEMWDEAWDETDDERLADFDSGEIHNDYDHDDDPDDDAAPYE